MMVSLHDAEKDFELEGAGSRYISRLNEKDIQLASDCLKINQRELKGMFSELAQIDKLDEELEKNFHNLESSIKNISSLKMKSYNLNKREKISDSDNSDDKLVKDINIYRYN